MSKYEISQTTSMREKMRRLHDEILPGIPNSSFKDLTGIAAHICDAPYACLALYDGGSLKIHGSFGFTPEQLSLDSSWLPFRSGATELLSDALTDSRFVNTGIRLRNSVSCRSALSSPLLLPGHNPVGFLAVFHSEPNAFNNSQAQLLAPLAQQITESIELHTRVCIHEAILRTRQRIESSLIAERDFAIDSLNAIPILVMTLDMSGRIVRFNTAAELLSGYRFRELAGIFLPADIFDFGGGFRLQNLINQATNGLKPVPIETRLSYRGGGERRILWNAELLRSETGEPQHIVLSGQDITLIREGEEAQRLSEERYRLLFENFPGFVLTHDLQGRLISINSPAAALLGYSHQDLAGRQITDLLEPSHIETFRALLGLLKGGAEAQREFAFQTCSGEKRILSCHSRLLTLPGVEPFALMHGVDMTEGHIAQKTLSRLQHQSESILESVHEGIFGMDANGFITFMNAYGATMLGYMPSELAGHPLSKLMHTDHAGARSFETTLQQIHAGLLRPSAQIDTVLRHCNGKPISIEASANPLVEYGKITGIVVAFEETSERRRLERMKDQFISTVSHELRTPLTSLRAALGLISAGQLKDRPDKLAQMMEIAISNCNRLVRLVNDIVDFESVEHGTIELYFSEVSVLELLRKAADMERHSNDYTGNSFRIDTEHINIWADEGQVARVLHHLLGNAIKFSPHGTPIHLAAHLEEHDMVEFEIQDSGRGISEEQLPHIFNAFQQGDGSDSRREGGTGLGLAMCRRIIELHGGRIWVTTAPGQGSCFHFTLPRSQTATRSLRHAKEQLNENPEQQIRSSERTG